MAILNSECSVPSVRHVCTGTIFTTFAQRTDRMQYITRIRVTETRHMVFLRGCHVGRLTASVHGGSARYLLAHHLRVLLSTRLWSLRQGRGIGFCKCAAH